MRLITGECLRKNILDYDSIEVHLVLDGGKTYIWCAGIGEISDLITKGFQDSADAGTLAGNIEMTEDGKSAIVYLTNDSLLCTIQLPVLSADCSYFGVAVSDIVAFEDYPAISGNELIFTFNSNYREYCSIKLSYNCDGMECFEDFVIHIRNKDRFYPCDAVTIIDMISSDK